MSYHTTHRPRTFDDVVGHTLVLASLKKAIAQGSRAFLFTGPAGVGKTTLARIIAGDSEIIDVDGATATGVDKMRAVAESAQHRSLLSSHKTVIVDECHALSKQTWQSLLKILEEPPEHLTWVLCTTELNKVPQTIRTRCVEYELHLLSANELRTVVRHVMRENELTMPDDVFELIIEQAQGSARRALTLLEKVQDCDTVDDAARLISRDVQTPEAYQLAKAMISVDRASIEKLLVAMKSFEAEGTRIVVMAYAHSTYLNSTLAVSRNRALQMMSAMELPCDTLTKHAPITLRVARYMHKVATS
jgi:DNA polymerase III gamma/tau subunit